MSQNRPVKLTVRWLLVCALTLLGPHARVDAQAPSRQESDKVNQKSVLVLFTTGRDSQISVIAERELPSLLRAANEDPVDYNSEYLDTGRFPDTERYQLAFSQYLLAKFGQRRFDLVMGMGEESVGFVAENQETLFPDTPLIFFSTRPVSRPFPESTGLIAETNFARTVELAAQLQPDIAQVFVVSGASDSDRALEERARVQFMRFEPRLSFTYLTGLPTPELERRLAALPARSIVYYLIAYQDGLGNQFNPLAYLDRIAAVANRPIYSWVDSTMGHGVVGGAMQNQRGRVDALATVALRVLRGEPASAIPVSTPDLHVNQLDWRELRRWGIDERRVPSGTQLLFREPGIWDRYRGYILGAAALLLAQTALIAGLLIEAARRRRAEERMRRSEGELRTSYERIRDLGSRLLSAQETERSRIARELHDDVSQQMAILAIDLQILHEADSQNADSKALIAETLKRSQTIARSVHDLSHRLHPAKLRLIGLVASLSGLQRDFAQPELEISFSHRDVPGNLPHDVTMCFFRIAQEALQNAVKHGQARHISMTLEHGGGNLELTVVDDGIGFDTTTPSTGLGLISMRERLDPLGGTLQVKSTYGHGTSIRASAPVTAGPAYYSA